tara:strand:+ start:258 stop:608 length:351 start_codon:yes stop_codon:yes gene_type:complete
MEKEQQLKELKTILAALETPLLGYLSSKISRLTTFLEDDKDLKKDLKQDIKDFLGAKATSYVFPDGDYRKRIEIILKHEEGLIRENPVLKQLIDRLKANPVVKKIIDRLKASTLIF